MNFKINVLGATALAVACSMLPIQAQAFLEDSDARKEILKQREDIKKINPRIDSEIKAINARIDSEIKNINTRIGLELFSESRIHTNLPSGDLQDV